MDFEIQDKVAIVTGGSRGIGRGVALKLAQQGAHVAICGRTPESLEKTAEEIRGAGVECWCYEADVTRLEDIERFIAYVSDRTDRIDMLVNNAVSSRTARFDELGDDLFRYHIDVKLLAYTRFARLVFPRMAQLGWGRIVNIAGMSARIVAPLRMTNGLVNAAVANFTKQFAAYAAEQNVTVNCVHPGYTVTERVMQVFEREAKETDTDLQSIIDKRTGDIPMGKLIQPEDIADVVLFFCSPLASMVTGQCIAVDGGSGQSVSY